MKKTYFINDLVWITLAFLVYIGGLKLGFGSFRQPQAGFTPFLFGLRPKTVLASDDVMNSKFT